MKIEPLPKKIYKKAKALNITEIVLQFEGGSDEGCLYIDFDRPKKKDFSELEEEIEDWAWSVYSYSGAGDGDPYGDNITYNLAEKTASYQGWFKETRFTEETERKLIVEL